MNQASLHGVMAYAVFTVSLYATDLHKQQGFDGAVLNVIVDKMDSSDTRSHRFRQPDQMNI